MKSIREGINESNIESFIFFFFLKEKKWKSLSVVPDSLRNPGLLSACNSPWNTGVGSLSLL